MVIDMFNTQEHFPCEQNQQCSPRALVEPLHVVDGSFAARGPALVGLGHPLLELHVGVGLHPRRVQVRDVGGRMHAVHVRAGQLPGGIQSSGQPRVTA